MSGTSATSATMWAVTGVGGVAPEAGAEDGDWFDHRVRLGPRGYKYLPAAAQYLLAAARDALADGGRTDAVPADRRGAALALNGGFAGLFDTMDRRIALEGGAAGLSPATAPFFAVSLLGSRLTSELSLKAFALTLASPRVAALEAVEAGGRALAAGRCDTLLVGAAEHRLPESRAGDGFPAGDGEQGAVALTLEPWSAAEARGARVRGTVAARSMFVPPGREPPAGLVSGAVRRLLSDLDTTVEVHHVLDGSPFASAVAAAVDRAAGATGRVTPAGSGCLAAAQALAGSLTGPPGTRLLTTATREGHAALALVRTGPDPNRDSGTSHTSQKRGTH
ncbi:beta-ketoacyl synthase N-terminal-like domain-containing protein [Streptomyces sp. NPDC058812]|uniref:beta-ketoacyl synthase N-terminal-like domain-containing protein n=1 Tax=unclassified Streptomyces TaxID=2593676 RepID=UPI0036CCE05F